MKKIIFVILFMLSSAAGAFSTHTPGNTYINTNTGNGTDIKSGSESDNVPSPTGANTGSNRGGSIAATTNSTVSRTPSGGNNINQALPTNYPSSSPVPDQNAKSVNTESKTSNSSDTSVLTPPQTLESTP